MLGFLGKYIGGLLDCVVSHTTLKGTFHYMFTTPR